VKLLPAIGWVCKDCKIMARSLCARLQSSVAELAEKFSQLQTDLLQHNQQMKSAVRSQLESEDVSQNEQQQQMLNSDIINTAVYTAVKDISRRKQNVIVTGLPESDDITDREAFLELCSSRLSVKPFIDDKACKRIGKSNPRRLLVRLKSETAATELLSVARRLRGADRYTAEHIYINPDLTPAEAKAAFEARKKRRDQKSQSSDSLKVASSSTVVLPPPMGVSFVVDAGHVINGNHDGVITKKREHSSSSSNDISTDAVKDNHGQPATSGGSAASSTVAQTALIHQAGKPLFQ
jgi:hypothetical protein